jgi:hypothetical protein
MTTEEDIYRKSLTTICDDHFRIINHNIFDIGFKYQLRHLKLRCEELLNDINVKYIAAFFDL